MDPLSILARKDKWFLGGGKGAIYAPPFPRHLLSPGFWDESYFADIRLTRLFTVLFTDFEGRPIRFFSEVVEWRPDRLVLLHKAPGFELRERRCVTESHAFVSSFEMLSGDKPLEAFVWSLQDLREAGHGAPWQSLVGASAGDESVRFQWDTAWPSLIEPDRTGVEDERAKGEGEMLPPLSLYVEIGSATTPLLGFTINLAQRQDDSPLWETSLIPQKFRNGMLPGDEKVFVGPPPVEGMVHLLQHYRVFPEFGLTIAAGVGLSPEAAEQAMVEAFTADPFKKSEEAWQSYFRSVPQFSSSDPYLTNAYWYRWYGLRLNTVDIPELPHLGHPFVTEGIGFFRNFVTYSAQAHLREVAWMHLPRLALGILKNLEQCQREDGSFPGHNYTCRPARDFYHADFATGATRLEKLHPGSIGPGHLELFKRYFDYFEQNRSEGFRYLVFDQNETGQEYMSRYQMASENADAWGSFVVAGVDATFYIANLVEFIADYAPQPPNFDITFTRWNNTLFEIGYAMGDMYDEDDHFWCDLLPNPDEPEDPWVSPRKSMARPASGFYFLMHSSEDSAYSQLILRRWLLNPDEFWLPKGFPATAKSDPTFSAEGEWKDKRLNCPWNGRSWPMVNSHLVDAISAVSRDNAGEALMKAITLMFHDGDPTRPNSYEHYDPITGTPSLYRGYDDYMHSWIVDLILRHAVGVQPGQDEVAPVPLDMDWIECTDIPHPKGRMHVRIERNEVVRLDIE